VQNQSDKEMQDLALWASASELFYNHELGDVQDTVSILSTVSQHLVTQEAVQKEAVNKNKINRTIKHTN
jgi:hypothetical protein